MARRAAQSNSRVLIFGESGTGKELFAQAIHNASPIRSGPFVAISCAAIPRDLVESELFGYEDGAFTGARKGGMIGKIELASGGTLFLDEINSLSLDIQAKLLRTLQQMEVVRIGGSRPISVDVRVISATNRKLLEAVRQGTFREDLYFRLNVVEIAIPPLRERKEDIPFLADLFIQRQSDKMRRCSSSFTPATLQIMQAYAWPGNVRELENVCERSLLVAEDDEITPANLPRELLSPPLVPDSFPMKLGEGMKIDAVYHSLIQSTLAACNGNISRAAKQLGVARSTLYRRMRTLGIDQGK
jgi:transcriptional regulator with PAS, ATPase and Fis domain